MTNFMSYNSLHKIAGIIFKARQEIHRNIRLSPFLIIGQHSQHSGFHESFMNFLGKHSFLTEVLDHRSDFKFLHFANVSHPRLLKVLYLLYLDLYVLGDDALIS